MNRETLMLLLALLVGVGLGAAGYSGLHSCPEIAANVAPVPETVETPEGEESPVLAPSETRPDREVQYVPYPVEVDTACLADTVTTYVPVPTPIAPPDPVVADDDGVEIRRPVFGTPTATFTYYDPRDGRVESRVYEVEPHPLRYGLTVEGYRTVVPAKQFGGGAEGYLGWDDTEVFLRGGHDPGLDWNVRAGVRLRFGR